MYISYCLYGYTQNVLNVYVAYSNQLCGSDFQEVILMGMRLQPLHVSSTDVDRSFEGKILLAPRRYMMLDLSRAKLIWQRMLAIILLYGSLVLQDCTEAILL